MKNWNYEGVVPPENSAENEVWRKGTERFLRIDGVWVRSGSYEELSKLEEMVKQSCGGCDETG